MKEVLKR